MRGVVNMMAEAVARRCPIFTTLNKSAPITVTNIGPLGGVFATPIINQPNVAILGMGKVQEKPVVRDGEIVIRNGEIAYDAPVEMPPYSI